MKTIGAKLGEINPGKYEIILPFNEKITQQHRLFHGGLVVNIADNSAMLADQGFQEDLLFVQPFHYHQKTQL